MQRSVFPRARDLGLIDAQPTAAVDGTGLESRHTSRHSARRRNTSRYRWRRYIQLTVACHTRWQVESAFSRHKRLLGDALRSRSFPAWERECCLRVLTQNLMILAAADP